VTDRLADDVATMTGRAALPRENGTLAFRAPWEGRAVAVAVAVVERLGLPWDAFRGHLIASIAADPERPYYESWADALEQLVVERGLTTAAALDAETPTERPTP
jgi:nitrile hydratase accessory protein